MNTRFLKSAALAAGVALVISSLVWPQRAWGSLLLGSFALLAVGLAGIFFVALQYASGAGWSVAFRRVPEAMSAALPFGATGLAVALVFGGSALYPWIHEPLHGFRKAWLNLPFFLIRATVFVAIWLLFTRAILKTSRTQDRDDDVRHTHRNIRLSVFFLVAFAVTFWLASFDWIMSLEPEWYSTIFGVYNFAGMFSSGLAVLILLVLRLRRDGPLADFVNEEHLHDLGKLLFAFCTFWMYIWFSQYMLVWYANITEEAVYYTRRLHGAWGPLFLVNMLLNWAIPFLMLLSRPTKRNPRILSKVCAIVLVGRWLDLYLMISPPLTGSSPAFGLPEIAALVGVPAAFLLVFHRAFRQTAPVPLRDPYLVESLHYHN